MKNASNLLPTLFLGHGSPMNAIAENAYTKKLNEIAKKLPQPHAILMISAHWVTRQTSVTAVQKPKTIHDFYGFPEALFSVNYPAPGSPELATNVKELLTDIDVHLDKTEWGLDHGAWSVLRHMYPEANIPVVQLSINQNEGPEFHYLLGQKLQPLREQGILILGSGNIVHNLRRISWEENAPPMSWAVEMDESTRSKLEARDMDALIADQSARDEHYTPLLTIAGASHANEKAISVYEEIQNGSISMRCVQFGE